MFTTLGFKVWGLGLSGLGSGIGGLLESCSARIHGFQSQGLASIVSSENCFNQQSENCTRKPGKAQDAIVLEVKFLQA